MYCRPGKSRAMSLMEIQREKVDVLSLTLLYSVATSKGMSTTGVGLVSAGWLARGSIDK